MADATHTAVASGDGDVGENNDGVGVHDVPRADSASDGAGASAAVASDGHGDVDDSSGDEWSGGVSLNGFKVTQSDVELRVRLQLNLRDSDDMNTPDRKAKMQELMCDLVTYYVSYYGRDVEFHRCAFVVKARRSARYMTTLEMRAAIEQLEGWAPALKEVFKRVHDSCDAETIRNNLVLDAKAYFKDCDSSTKRYLMGILTTVRGDRTTGRRGRAQVPVILPRLSPLTEETPEQVISQLTLQLQQAEAQNQEYQEAQRRHDSQLHAEQQAHAATKARFDMFRVRHAGSSGVDDQSDDAQWAETVVAAVTMIRVIQSHPLNTSQCQALVHALEKETTTWGSTGSADRATMVREMVDLQHQLAEATKKQQEICANADQGPLARRLHIIHKECQSLISQIEKLGATIEHEETRNEGPDVTYNRAWCANLKRQEDSAAGAAIPGMGGLLPRTTVASRRPGAPAFSDVVRAAPGMWKRDDYTYKEWTEQKAADQATKREVVDNIVKETVSEETVYQATVHSADQGTGGKTRRQIRAFLDPQQAQDLFGRDVVNRSGIFRHLHYRGTDRRVSATQVFLDVPSGTVRDIPRTVQIKLRNKFSWRTHQALRASTWREAPASPAPDSTWY